LQGAVAVVAERAAVVALVACFLRPLFPSHLERHTRLQLALAALVGQALMVLALVELTHLHLAKLLLAAVVARQTVTRRALAALVAVVVLKLLVRLGRLVRAMTAAMASLVENMAEVAVVVQVPLVTMARTVALGQVMAVTGRLRLSLDHP